MSVFHGRIEIVAFMEDVADSMPNTESHSSGCYLTRLTEGEQWIQNILVLKKFLVLWSSTAWIPDKDKLISSTSEPFEKSYFLRFLKFCIFLLKYSALERNGVSIWWKFLILHSKFESKYVGMLQFYNAKSRIFTKSRHRYAPKQSTWEGKMQNFKNRKK